jgi:hypothetical protein
MDKETRRTFAMKNSIRYIFNKIKNIETSFIFNKIKNKADCF